MLKTFSELPFLKLKINDRGELARRAHSHGEVSLGYIFRGSARITSGELDYLMRPGDLILIPAEQVHICRPDDEANYDFVMLYLDAPWWTDQFEGGAMSGTKGRSFLPLASPASPIQRSFFDGLKGGSLPGEEELAAILTGLQPERRTSVDSASQSVLSDIHELIRSCPEESYPVDELAERAGMDKFAFIRRYARIYGLTPHADLINMKIQRAILMLESSASLTDIGFECGFSDQSHFIRHFKLYTGLTPSEYRKALL